MNKIMFIHTQKGFLAAFGEINCGKLYYIDTPCEIWISFLATDLAIEPKRVRAGRCCSYAYRHALNYIKDVYI